MAHKIEMVRAVVLLAGFAGALLSAAPARADAIDGDWCQGAGRTLQIQGPQIITPEGRKLQGRYGRHDFSYTESGSVVQMTLLNEQTMTLRRAADPGALAQAAAETWKRCQGAVSWRSQPLPWTHIQPAA